MQIYVKLPGPLLVFMDAIITSKCKANLNWKHLVHPKISQDRLEIFLRSLGYGVFDDPLDIALFEHLKTTSISKENVERAARR